MGRQAERLSAIGIGLRRIPRMAVVFDLAIRIGDAFGGERGEHCVDDDGVRRPTRRAARL